MKKVIFLDIDGVLNLCRQERDQYGSLFHPYYERNLRMIIDQTAAKIVISSTWRMSGLEIMQEMWKERNLPSEVIDITPSIHNSCRGEEINYWLKNNKVDAYCIIDDDSDMLISQFPYFVRTSNNHTHIGNIEGYGLTKECAENVINILNNGKSNN